MILLLLGQLRLCLFILFESFLALIARQLAMRRALGHALSLCPAAGTLGGNRVALDNAHVVRIARVAATARVGRLDLPVDGVLVLAARVPSDPDLAPRVLVVRIQLAACSSAALVGSTNHVHVRPTVRVVLLAVVGGELVLVLEEGVLGALGSAGAI